MLNLLRQYLLPFNGSPWLSYFGLALLLLTLLAAPFSRPLAYGLMIASYVVLLGMPFSLTPKIWRALISNQQLALIPGFARMATATAFAFTLLQIVYLTGFSELFGIGGPQLRQTALLFINSSLYMIIMQYAVTTSWALAAISLLPALSMASLLFIMNGFWRRVLGDDHLVWLCLACLLGWMLAWWRVGLTHRTRPQHSSVVVLKDWQRPQMLVAPWPVDDSEARNAPATTLLLGYPPTPGLRLRIMIYSVFFGPMIATLFLSVVGFGGNWRFHPGVLDTLLATSLFPATFGAFQNVDWVARLRLLWLRGPALRQQLWQMLEYQLVIHVLLLTLVCGVLAAAGLWWSQFSTGLLLHYPLLVLIFNAFYSYYMVCARLRNWSTGWGLLLSFVLSSLMVIAGWFVLRHDSYLLLFALEALICLLVLCLRPLAKRRLLSIDWLMVKPLRLAKLAN